MEELISKIYSFEEVFNIYYHNNRELENFRQDISNTWDDNASKDINSKFLNPFSEECEIILENYKNQIQKIKSINEIKDKIGNNCQQILQTSSDIDVHLDHCKSSIDNSYKILQNVSSKEVETNISLQKTGELFKELETLKNKHKSFI